MKECGNQGAQDLKGAGKRKGKSVKGKIPDWDENRVCSPFARRLTLFRVCVCPIRMRALDEMIDRQKLMRMTERSDRMYLQEGSKKTHNNKLQLEFFSFARPDS